MKKLSIFGKSVPIIVLMMISILVVGASAGLLTYYGGVTSDVTVDQAILLDGLSWPASDLVADEIAGTGGDTVYGAEHNLTSQSENRIVVDLVTVPGYNESISEVYPMYKLDSIVGDDAVSVVLDAPIAWGAFVSVPFSYLIEQDDAENYWIPQININLLNSTTGELAYRVAWHSFRHGITGTLDELSRITALKEDFFYYESNWGVLGFYGDLTEEQQDAVDLMIFNLFSSQAGDTSVDPNDPPALSQEIAWVGNYDMDVKGIIINPEGYTSGIDAVRDTVEFRMVYVLEIAAPEGLYPVETNVVPIGLV